MNRETYYIITGYAPDAPSFVSAQVTYLATMDDLKRYAIPGKKYALSEAIEKFFEGENLENWFGQVMVVEKEIEVIRKEVSYDLLEYDFCNLWKYSHIYHFKNLRGKLLYCKIDGVYYRFEYMYVDDVHSHAYHYGKDISDYKLPLSDNWGNQVVRGKFRIDKHGCMKPEECVDCDEEPSCTKYEEIGDFYTVFAMLHRAYEREEEMMKDYENPEMVNLDNFFFDIHADG